MSIVKRKSTHVQALALLAALVIFFRFLSSSPTPAALSEQTSTSLVVRRLHEDRRKDMKGEGKPDGAAWYMSQRKYGLGYIPQDAEIRAVDDMRRRMIPELAAKGMSLQKSAAGDLNWEYHGPGNIGGRLRGLVVHPNNPNILYAGSVSGGVWKSTNGGVSWSPTMNDLITLNISALAMKPGDPNTLYAGTGEAFIYADNLPGRGILKTTDGGSSWKRVHVAQGLNAPFITAIAVSPASPNVVYAAGRQADPQIPDMPAETIPDPGVSAIFKSTDSGETWQDITTGKGIEHDPSDVFDNFAADVVASPTDANVVYATFGLHYWGGIWKSTNGGQSWTRLSNGLPNPNLPNLGYGRIKLAMAPSNPNLLYATFTYEHKQGDTADLKDGAMLGLWKTTNGGQSWTQVTTPLTSSQRNRNDRNTTPLGAYGNYAHALIVHPTNPDIVFVGGLDIYKSTDGGNSWSQASMWRPVGTIDNPEGIPYVHADHHVFVFDRSTNPPMLYDGSDGGVARSRDLGATWETINNDLGVTQFYSLVLHPTDAQIMLGGTQDNGTLMVTTGRSEDWLMAVPTGDGWVNYFDVNDPSTVYVAAYNVHMRRLVYDYTQHEFVAGQIIGFTDGSNGITQEDVNGASFFAPFEMSPNNPTVFVLGTNRLLKTTNRGDSWTALSTRVNVPIISVAIAEGDDSIIWMATSDARIYKTEDNGATYTNVTGTNLPNRFVTDIEFDPSNNRTVYLTYSGYGTPHVFKSTNAGASWTNLTNNLPDAPANTLQVHPQQPNTLFLGTDIGVFLSQDGGQTWQPCTNGFPTVQVTAIVLNTEADRVFAATHGRGVYSAPLPGDGVPVLNVETQEIAIDTKPGQTGTASFTIANSGNAALNFTIATSGGIAGAAAGSMHGERASLSHVNVPLGTKLPAPARGLSFRKDVFQTGHQARTKEDRSRMTAEGGAVTPKTNAGKLSAPIVPVFVLGQPAALSGNDVLVLDDGNDLFDDFIGEGPNSFNDFFWMNRFDLAQDFLLENIQVYMRTEAQGNNPVEIAVMDGDFNDLGRGTVNLGLAPNGGWFTIDLTNPLSFKAGSTFCLEIGASFAIAYPAGADKNAQVPNRSYHYNWDTGQYDAIGAVTGFVNGAYMIRALGTKSGGNTNRPPVAKAQLSLQQAHVNEAITFDGSQSYDPDGQITQYLWDFGDGTTSNQKVATHAYAQAGNRLIKLTVTDDQGATGQTIGLITISGGGTSRLAVTPTNGTIAPGGKQMINVSFDVQGLAEGSYQGQIAITSDGGNRTIPVRVRVSNNVGQVAELSYDNGTPTTEYSWSNAGQGSAVRFTPPATPAKLTQAKIFIKDLTNGDQFSLRVLADANGAPGNTIYGPAPVTVANTGWATFDLSAANISINGDFYVMIEYNGTSEPTFGSEATEPIAGRSWDFYGDSWELFDTEDYLIRAVVAITTGVTAVERNANGPEEFELSQNYPNPLNPETTIKYHLPSPAQVELKVYDLGGRFVAELDAGIKDAGEHLVRWNGRDSEGIRVASGIYFYHFTATPAQGAVINLTRKLSVLK